MTKWFFTLSWAGLIFYLTTLPNFAPSSNSTLSFILSNCGHFFFFGVQAILLKQVMRFPILTTTMYGLLIELVQRGIPGRSFSLFDLGLDALGAWLFVYLVRKYYK